MSVPIGTVPTQFVPDQHRWVLQAVSCPPAELADKLAKERDHYRDTVFCAGRDPRDNSALYHFGIEPLLAHMDKGIKAAVAIASDAPGPVHVTIFGRVRSATPHTPGDELSVSVSVAQVP
jgi:hypothetical protein